MSQAIPKEKIKKTKTYFLDNENYPVLEEFQAMYKEKCGVMPTKTEALNIIVKNFDVPNFKFAN